MNSGLDEVLLPLQPAALQLSIPSTLHSAVEWFETNIVNTLVRLKQTRTEDHVRCKMIASKLHLAANRLTHVPIDGKSFMTHRAAHQRGAVEMFWDAPVTSVSKYNRHLRPATITARRCRSLGPSYHLEISRLHFEEATTSQNSIGRIKLSLRLHIM